MAKQTGKKGFIDQFTRRLMVKWAYETVVVGEITRRKDDRAFHDYASSKKWLSADGTKVLSTGFNTAAAFLRR